MVFRKGLRWSYDSGDQDILVARVTTQPYATDADYKIVNWKRCGLVAESFARLGKLATIQKHFVVRQLGSFETREIDELKSILRKMFSLKRWRCFLVSR